jgi:glycosyltransferase involved in cell wall biosynthesis
MYKDRKNILVLCPFPVGVAAGQRLKYEQYFEQWRAQGINVTVSAFLDMETWNVLYQRGYYKRKLLGVLRGHSRRVRDLFRMRSYDAVYIFMWVTPFGTATFEMLTRVLARKLIFDVEDNVLVEQKLPVRYNPNSIIRRLKGPGKARFLIKTADCVIASSPFLSDFCRSINKNASSRYISSSVDVARYLPREQSSTRDAVTIGWTGTFSSKMYLESIAGMLQKLAQKTKFKMRVIGNFEFELPGVDLEVVQWSKETEIEDLREIDIGIYPLPIDEWVLGKSGLKAIQYMAMGIPTVATDVGTTSIIIRHGQNGMLVKSEDEWISALEILAADPDLRRRLGSNARVDVERNYSTEVIGREYLDVLKHVLGR